MNNKTFIIIILILIAGAAIGFMSYLPTRFDISSRVRVADFPIEVEEWQGVDIPLSERDYEILETKNLIMREYKNFKGESIYLYIIYSEDNRKVAHPPEICLSGGGLSILSKSSVQMTDSIRAMRLFTEKGNLRQLVIYWYKAANLNTDKYLKQQLKLVIDRTLGKRTACAMIRVSTTIGEAGEAGALELLRSFTRQIEPLLVKYVP